MTVTLARLQSVPEQIEEAPPSGHTRRKEPRFAASFEARLENARGDAADVLLAEVSLHGCRVQCAESWIRTGSFISIGIADAAKLQAIVRWVRDDSVGMEFLRAIPDERTEWHDLMDASY
ncbi:MAG: PilZ domain-containing protein [Sphingomonadaceae bacterium]|nr:PilZ domain-containing protein [Sphingomonadaceae bacterium]